MPNQDQYWSQAARSYEKDFIDPYRKDVFNPLLTVLARLAHKKKTAADLGCGIGPLLPFLAERFAAVHALDFAEGMLARARERAAPLDNVRFLQGSMTDLEGLHGRIDVALAVNSLVMPDPRDLDKALAEIRKCVRPKGRFLGILPAMDAVHYYNLLLLDRALAAGLPLDAARKNAAHFGEFSCYDFAFGQFEYEGLEQHFWQPFEITRRFEKAGFEVRLKKVHLSWKQFARGKDLKKQPPPWDWFFFARPVKKP